MYGAKVKYSQSVCARSVANIRVSVGRAIGETRTRNGRDNGKLRADGRIIRQSDMGLAHYVTAHLAYRHTI